MARCTHTRVEVETVERRTRHFSRTASGVIRALGANTREHQTTMTCVDCGKVLLDNGDGALRIVARA